MGAETSFQSYSTQKEEAVSDYEVDDDDAMQQQFHEAVEKLLKETGDIGEGEILAGWNISYEIATMSDSKRKAGNVYGPSGMSTWRALGLIEWVRRFILTPGDDDEDDDE